MKVVVISTGDDTLQRYQAARQQGYITFVYDHADPLRRLAADKFMYVESDEELDEKLRLLRADPTVVDQVLRF